MERDHPRMRTINLFANTQISTSPVNLTQNSVLNLVKQQQ